MKNQIKTISKLMSLTLRHHPETLYITLDEQGWANVDELIHGINRKGIKIDLELLNDVVENNDKKRFSFNDDKSKIRANQGHSLKVNVDLKEVSPPEYLYHGTVSKFMSSIKSDGLKKMSRLHVHLSDNKETAKNVGSRRGKPIVLTIRTGKMSLDNYNFYLSDNGVWLTDHVPSEYIEF